MRLNTPPLALLFLLGPPANAFAEWSFDENGLRGDFDRISVRGGLVASAQIASIDPLTSNGDSSGSDVDAAARLDIGYTTDNALVFGIAGQVDTAFGDISDFERNELNLYLAAEWGRIELGENDGPADRLSFAAPRVGLGQVRGDFGRYLGSVALLTPYDSRDAAKLTFLSAPLNGFRAGISYAPNFDINRDNPDPEFRQLQSNVVEIAAQYNAVFEGTAIGFSFAWVRGDADEATEREDIDSFGAGFELRRGRLTIGGAWLDRGRSNLPILEDPLLGGDDSNEINAGIRWEETDWSVAASIANSEENGQDISRIGIGGTWRFRKYYYLAGDFVHYETDLPVGITLDGNALLLEAGVRFY